MGRHSCNGHKGIFTHAEHSSSWEKSLPVIEILTGGKPCKHSSANTERSSRHHPSGLWNTVSPSLDSRIHGFLHSIRVGVLKRSET